MRGNRGATRRADCWLAPPPWVWHWGPRRRSRSDLPQGARSTPRVRPQTPAQDNRLAPFALSSPWSPTKNQHG
ncbi:MAG: hypothetical protein ACKO3P_05630, partial [Planctomycetaceae bacterium]